MYVLARLSFGFVVGALAVVLALQGAVWLMGQVGMAAIQLFPMRAPLPATLPGLTQPAIIGGLWGLLFILIWDRWGRQGIVKGAGFGTLFGLVGPGLVLWVVWPALRGAALFEGGNAGRIVAGAALAVAFGIGLAWIGQILNGYMRYAAR
ncbi:MAG: hypothetical protein Q8O26_12465 [Phreatobacter sp.]|uniref:hypothetical protein n=1 Tax=Phreatobacter sp. TaxID=1966341 RepID=UPI0027353579|nr:hypothetical protein [Phreatobacter sp.]MDP2802686.1 hypothetical protein [Phreatobacter sp.]